MMPSHQDSSHLDLGEEQRKPRNELSLNSKTAKKDDRKTAVENSGWDLNKELSYSSQCANMPPTRLNSSLIDLSEEQRKLQVLK